ncbi:hypothetical protein Fmac_032815 [Flemingia macrophylla]|uniref:Uncharacterized protein n=1 Tax=Flemingia macrophylla TaxID=520843 RepID=A0ABD1L5Z5_9FABA
MQIKSLPQVQESALSVLPMTTILVSVLLHSNLEWMSILRLRLQTPIAGHHSRVHDVAMDTSAETRKLEGKLDALVNLVAQLEANQKLATVPRVCDIRSFNDHNTSTTTTAETMHLIERMAPNSKQFSARIDAIVIRGVHDVATGTSTETRKLEGKLDAIVYFVTQLAANQKPASVARVCDIRSSNDHHTSQISARNDVIVFRGVHDVDINTSTETRNLEGKLDALVNLVTQLAANQKPTSVARVCNIRSSNDQRHHNSRDKALDREDGSQLLLEGKLDALVNLVTQQAANQKPTFVARVCSIRSSNDHHTSVCPSSQQFGVDEHPEAYAANTYSRPPQGVYDVAKDTSAETRKLEGKLDANQKRTSISTVWGIRSSNDHHTSFSTRNDAIVIGGVHDVATYTSAETRKLEGKLHALVNLVTQLAANQKPGSVARVCDIRASNDHHTSACPSSQQSQVDEHPRLMLQSPIKAGRQAGCSCELGDSTSCELEACLCCNSLGIHSSNDHHTSVYPSSQQSRVDEHPEAYAAITYSRPPQGVHDVATDISAETRKLEGKQDALVNLVTQLALNHNLASVARVCDIRSPNDHHTTIADHHSSRDKALDREDSSQLLAVTQLAANQKPDSVARVRAIRSSNDHHTSFSARNVAIVIRGVHDVATDTSPETKKLEGKLDANVNLVTQLAANQKPASVARVCGIRSSNDHHTSVCPSSQQSGVDEHPVAYFRARNDAIVIRGVQDVATYTSAENTKLEGKLDALVNLVTHLAVNHKPSFVARVCAIADHHSSRDKALDREDGSQILALRIKRLPLLQEFAASVLPMTTILVSVLLRSNLEWMSILRLMLQTPIAGHHSRRDKALDREDGSQLLALEGNLDTLLNLEIQLAANQKSDSVARVCGIRSSNDHHTSVCPSSQQSGVDEYSEAYAANTYSKPPQKQKQDT